MGWRRGGGLAPVNQHFLCRHFLTPTNGSSLLPLYHSLLHLILFCLGLQGAQLLQHRYGVKGRGNVQCEGGRGRRRRKKAKEDSPRRGHVKAQHGDVACFYAKNETERIKTKKKEGGRNRRGGEGEGMWR